MRRTRGSVPVPVLLAALVTVGCSGDAPPGTRSFHLEGLAVGTVVAGEPLPGGRAALYAELLNRADTPVVLTGVELEGQGRAELHRSFMEEGRRMMRPVDSIVVGPGETVRLEPGGLHVMMQELPGSLGPGDSLRARLVFRSGAGLGVTARVVPLADLEEIFAGGEPEG